MRQLSARGLEFHAEDKDMESFNVDELFKHATTPEEKEVCLKCYNDAIKPYIDEWSKDPLADHHAIYAEMHAKMMAVLLEYNRNLESRGA